jgi:hypothetical protein
MNPNILDSNLMWSYIISASFEIAVLERNGKPRATQIPTLSAWYQDHVPAHHHMIWRPGDSPSPSSSTQPLNHTTTHPLQTQHCPSSFIFPSFNLVTILEYTITQLGPGFYVAGWRKNHPKLLPHLYSL